MQKINKLCHINLLKPYYARLSSEMAKSELHAKTDVVSPVLLVESVDRMSARPPSQSVAM